MDVDDVVLAETEHTSQRLAQLEAPGESRLRAVRVNWLALSDAHDMRLGPRSWNVRGDDVNLVSEAARLAREEMHVLAYAAEMRVVVLGHERDAQRP